MSITIGSYPNGTKIYVGDKFYGETPSRINLTPDKDKVITLKKNGWKDKEVTLKTIFSLRKERKREHRRCKLDLYGTFLFILPITSLKSVHCRDFDRRSYYFEMDKGVSSLIQNRAPTPNKKLTTQYNPYQSQGGAQATQNQWQRQLRTMPAALRENKEENNSLPNSSPSNNINYYW